MKPTPNMFSVLNKPSMVGKFALFPNMAKQYIVILGQLTPNISLINDTKQDGSNLLTKDTPFSERTTAPMVLCNEK